MSIKEPQDSTTPLDNKVDFWIENDLNVLFTGTQGVGKSTIIEEAFNRNNLKFKYFTASLMDPYLTLIGVPKEKVLENGESVLEYIKPKEFSNDIDLGVEAIFFDEFNRASPAVRNAVMELIQFKSINGVRLPNLRVVWAAINPADEEETFDVFELDPAQKDRFHVQYVLDNEPNHQFFKDKFGSHMSKIAIKWWKGIPDEIKKHISPRRLEYALDMYRMGGDVSDTLISESRPDDLVRKLQDMTGGEGTNIDRWMSDPQSFLNDITDQNNPYEGDVVKAFVDLKNYSMDMATDLVGSLLPEQLRTIADDDDAIDLLLRNYIGPKSESVKSTLDESGWHDQHHEYIYNKLDKNAPDSFLKAFKAGDFDGMKNNLDSGYTYLVTLMWAKDNLDEFPTDLMREFYKEKPRILKFLAQWDYKTASQLFEPPKV